MPNLKTRLQVAAGQGELWLAESDDPFADDVVVKFLSINSDPDFADDDRKRFAREVRCQSTLLHPAIMPILQYNLDADRPWYSMPKADATLDEVLDRSSGGLPQDQIVSIMVTVMDAVEFAHGEGVLHRDLKPANILHLPGASMANAGWVVADFGLCRDRRSASSRITQVRSRVGTVEYMAPEQFDDAHEVGVTADIYSLGKVLAHCLTGKVPFPVVRWNDLPDNLRQVIRRCLADDPAERYQSINSLRSDLLTLAASGLELLNPLDECRRILGVVLAGSPASADALQELVAALLANVDDEHLHIQMIPELADVVIGAMLIRFPVESSTIFRNFDRFSDLTRATVRRRAG